MIRRILIPLAMLALYLPALAIAQPPPSPPNCTIPGHFLVCPSGDTFGGVVLRDATGMPCMAYPVTLVFTPPAFNALCVQPGFPFPNQTVNTDLAGNAPFAFFMGGFALSGAAQIFDGITGALIGTVPVVVSPDMNGDCIVNLSDVSMFASAYFGGYVPSADFNQDGILNLVDVTILAQHVGH